MTIQCTSKILDKVLFMNQKILTFTGYHQEEVKTARQLMPAIVAEHHNDLLLNFIQNKNSASARAEIYGWLKCKDGAIMPCKILSQPYLDLRSDFCFTAVI